MRCKSYIIEYKVEREWGEYEIRTFVVPMHMNSEWKELNYFGTLHDAKVEAKRIALKHHEYNPDGVEIYEKKRVGKVEIPGHFSR